MFLRLAILFSYPHIRGFIGDSVARVKFNDLFNRIV